MKVLIADDSSVSRRLLEAALRKWNYDVVVACDGQEAWNHLQHEDAPRLAILDWMMPGISGLEVCRRVRQLACERYTYILLVTARTHKEDLIEGMEAGVFVRGNPKLLAFALFGAVNWIPRWYNPDGASSSQEIADLFADFFIAGLRPSPM